MKAITLKQPWASWIARGIKTIETRTWATAYRGPLLICASKSPVVCRDADGTWKDFPAGVALAAATLEDCRPMTREDQAAARCEIYPRAQAWVLGRVHAFKAPWPVKGNRRLFNLELPVAAARELEASGYYE